MTVRWPQVTSTCPETLVTDDWELAGQATYTRGPGGAWPQWGSDTPP